MNNKKSENKERTVSCPFCKERGFNLLGLKYHIYFHQCKVYEDIKVQTNPGVHYAGLDNWK